MIPELILDLPCYLSRVCPSKLYQREKENYNDEFLWEICGKYETLNGKGEALTSVTATDTGIPRRNWRRVITRVDYIRVKANPTRIIPGPVYHLKLI